MGLCSSSVSGIMANHNTHVAPVFILNVLTPTPVNMAILQGLLGPLPVGSMHHLYLMFSQQGNRLSLCGPRTPRLFSQGFTLPTRALPGIKLRSFRLCAPSVYRVLVEFKPSLQEKIDPCPLCLLSPPVHFYLLSSVVQVVQIVVLILKSAL